MFQDSPTLDDYIARHQVDGVLWKAEKLLANLDNKIMRNDAFEKIAHTLALIPKPVIREDYGKQISKDYEISWPTFKKMIDDHLAIHSRKEKVKAKAEVKKNRVRKLEGDPEKWPFFIEKLKVNQKTQEVTFTGIEIDTFKFIQMLISFGFVRYEGNIEQTGKDEFQFVRLEENIIRSVTRQQIIDEIERFILNKYDFTRCEHVDAELLINEFYNNLNRYFSKDMFARMKPEEPIIINRDLRDKTFFYYKNGFAEITKDGWDLHNYNEMSGSVWSSQMNGRKFSPMNLIKNDNLEEFGMYADFCWKIANQNAERFAKLTAIMGYAMHDFYGYKLKAINVTDSTISEASEGRTGKTLWAKMMGHVRGYTEINGKEFKSNDERKYQLVNLGTQIMHLNDLKTRGQNKFDFEDVFNDITEGYMVRKMYQSVFRHRSKIILSSNKTLNIVGGSQRDRILEFEISEFFGEHLSPGQHYGKWFPEPDSAVASDWDDKEWQRFDNFMCFCAAMFHKHGLQAAAPINLGARKLINHTDAYFLDFMSDCRKMVETEGKPFDEYNIDAFNRTKDFFKFEFDKKQLFVEFIKQYNDFKSWLTQKTFNKWLHMYADLELKIKNPRDWRSNSVHYIQFVETPKEEKK